MPVRQRQGTGGRHPKTWPVSRGRRCERRTSERLAPDFGDGRGIVQAGRRAARAASAASSWEAAAAPPGRRLTLEGTGRVVERGLRRMFGPSPAVPPTSWPEAGRVCGRLPRSGSKQQHRKDPRHWRHKCPWTCRGTAPDP